jgi:type IV secretion system protein VirB4
VDDSKQAAVQELGECLKAIGNEGKYFGEFSLSVVLYDKDETKVDEAIPEFQKVVTTHDGLLYEERYNLLNAFFATVPNPGRLRPNRRPPPSQRFRHRRKQESKRLSRRVHRELALSPRM